MPSLILAETIQFILNGFVISGYAGKTIRGIGNHMTDGLAGSNLRTSGNPDVLSFGLEVNPTRTTGNQQEERKAPESGLFDHTEGVL
jgi:hypothetical protein